MREELAETIHLNETLGAPSARTTQRLFEAIDAETAVASAETSFDFGGWLAGLIEQVSPRTLAWSAAAAGLAIVLQAGLLAGVLRAASAAPPIRPRRSIRRPRTHPQGAFALVRFNPEANAADITKFFAAHKATLVEGPQPGGVYRIRVAPTALSQAELAKIVAQMSEDKGVVAFIVPARSQ